MKDLNYQLNQLYRRNRDGSYRTQADRAGQLNLIADQLFALGYRHLGVRSLKPKHVEALVAHWKASGIAIGSIKNRLSVLRWWAQKSAAMSSNCGAMSDRPPTPVCPACTGCVMPMPSSVTRS